MDNRLRVLRAERVWSQAEVAERVGVSRQTVNAVETGKVRTNMNPSEPSAPIATPEARSERRHARAFVILPVLFLAAYCGARAGIETTAAGSMPALAFALLPVPFLAAFLWIYVRGVGMMDELERRIHLEALALAFPIALLVVFTAGLLHLAGFEGEDNWDLPRLFPLVLLPYWFGLFRARKKYM
jgi:putative transcriptional regulator